MSHHIINKPLARKAFQIIRTGFEDYCEAFATITEEEIREYTQVLASDDFEGRAPSSPGEELTIQYLTEQFASLGLEPGGTDGSWVQEVPMVAITADPDMALSISGIVPIWRRRTFPISRSIWYSACRASRYGSGNKTCAKRSSSSRRTCQRMG